MNPFLSIDLNGPTSPNSLLVPPMPCTCDAHGTRLKRIGLVIHDVHTCPAAMDRWVVTPPNFHKRVFAQRATAREALVATMEALGRGFRVSEIGENRPSRDGEIVHFRVGEHGNEYRVETEHRYFERGGVCGVFERFLVERVRSQVLFQDHLDSAISRRLLGISR